jgi:molecular chaperone IbpA
MGKTSYNFNSQSLLPYTIGFDNIFKSMEDIMGSPERRSGFPFYDIIENVDDENKFYINLAVAGYNERDITIELNENHLIIKSDVSTHAKNNNYKYIWNGITKHDFVREFRLSPDIKVHSASLIDGILQVTLIRIIPEDKKTKTIQINATSPPENKTFLAE